MSHSCNGETGMRQGANPARAKLMYWLEEELSRIVYSVGPLSARGPRRVAAAAFRIALSALSYHVPVTLNQSAPELFGQRSVTEETYDSGNPIASAMLSGNRLCEKYEGALSSSMHLTRCLLIRPTGAPTGGAATGPLTPYTTGSR